MTHYKRNDGRFPNDAAVWTPYPLDDSSTSQEDWPWLRGSVLGQCGPDEWHILIEAPQLTEHGDGYIWRPACFRESCELRLVQGTD